MRWEKEKLISLLDRAMEFSMCAMVFTLAFSKTLVEFFFVLAMASWLIKRYIIKAFKPVQTDLNLPIAVFIFVGFLSTICSISLPLSLEGFFFKLVEWVMIYFIVAEVFDSKKKMDRIIGVILFSMALIAIDGIFQFITGTDFIRNYYVAGHRIQGPFSNSNSFAGWLVVMVPLALSLAYFGFQKVMKPVLWIITGLLILCLALTYSRGAWIAAVLSLILLAAFKSKRLLAFIIIAVLIIPFIAPEPMKKRISTVFRITELAVKRPYIWRDALNIVEDFPLLGSGLNTYAMAGPKYESTEGAGHYPHNSYLHMAAESGLLGLGAFIWIMIRLYGTSLANLRRINNRFYSALLMGLLTGLSAFLMHSFVDVNIYTLQLGNLMWVTMGLIVSAQKISLQDE